MFVFVGQVERGLRGREGFQEIDLIETIGAPRQVVGASPTTPATAAATLEAAVRATVDGRPGPVAARPPEDLLDRRCRTARDAPSSVRTPPPRPTTRSATCSSCSPRAERPVILAGAGVLRARCSNDLVRLAELLHVPVIASWRRGDVIPNDHPLYLGMTGYGSPATVRERLATRGRAARDRLPARRDHDVRLPDPGRRPRWAHVDIAPGRSPSGSPAPDDHVTRRRPPVPPRRRRPPPATRRPRREPVEARDRAQRRGPRRLGGGDGHRRPPLDRPRASIPAGSSRPCASCCPTTPSSPRTPAASGLGGARASGSAGRARSSVPRPARWATACPAAIAAALVHRDRPVVALSATAASG